MEPFPEPVSGQPIPRGWFARLVRRMNMLRLRGDGRFFAVSDSPSGQRIAPTPALLQLLDRASGAPSSVGSGVPNYAAGEAVTTGQSYTISSAGWIIGTVKTSFPTVIGNYYATWTLELSQNGSQLASIVLSDVSASINTISESHTHDAFVSLLLPPGVGFTVAVNSNLASGNLTSTLKAYPIL